MPPTINLQVQLHPTSNSVRVRRAPPRPTCTYTCVLHLFLPATHSTLLVLTALAGEATGHERRQLTSTLVEKKTFHSPRLYSYRNMYYVILACPTVLCFLQPAFLHRILFWLA
ncbi:hypothetical protein M440DRAFT_1243909 [Trichoderma longibrachiatum ATCC 18648]|uniref:Uncharacterized protein n=1 Tax=Trichoderma longibrachiatum ATCC 18648 TaxID=983965 RepID=A0A2T4C373_TRILO|nr:hypothetical protein M440DRAFT_1243909 [Trichoderma longibrachiatum ATCC 18648]